MPKLEGMFHEHPRSRDTLCSVWKKNDLKILDSKISEQKIKLKVNLQLTWSSLSESDLIEMDTIFASSLLVTSSSTTSSSLRCPGLSSLAVKSSLALSQVMASFRGFSGDGHSFEEAIPSTGVFSGKGCSAEEVSVLWTVSLSKLMMAEVWKASPLLWFLSKMSKPMPNWVRVGQNGVEGAL